MDNINRFVVAEDKETIFVKNLADGSTFWLVEYFLNLARVIVCRIEAYQLAIIGPDEGNYILWSQLIKIFIC